MASLSPAARRRLAALRSALDEQLAALGEPPYAGPGHPAAALTACVQALLRAQRRGLAPHRPAVKAAVRATLAELASRYPGQAVEVRVPPYGAVQCFPGPRHTRGTPPNVVETSAEVWLGLVTGSTDFATALEAGSIEASGTRADLSEHLPLFSPAESEERR